ncbi:MAG: T9SS type A sorting domain-containing protein [Phaeodactylibacter sp.]|uniref:T9SS type A sorting domain-containing protein n=1 Tax=Phaeodactylibacter sp. TaxID=1940289 RepID=UPI0032EB6276
MQKLALSVVLFVFSTTVSAQWEKAFPELMSGEVTKILERHNGNYAMLVPNRNRLLEFTPAGELITNEALPYDLNAWQLFSLEETPDSALAFPVNVGFCSGWANILLIDSEGVRQEVPFEQGTTFNVLPLAGESFLVHNYYDDMLQEIKVSGQVVREIPFPGGQEFLEFERLSDTTIAIGTLQHIIITDTALSVLDTLPGYRGQQVESNGSGGLISYDQDSVWLHDEAMQLQAVVASASGAAIESVTIGFGQVAILHDNGLINIYDSTLQPLSGFNIDQGIQPNDFAVTPTGYLLVGRAGFAPFIKHYQFNGFSESKGYDIALSEISVQGPAILGTLAVQAPVGEVQTYDLPIARFTLENYGSDTIHTLFLTINFPWVSYNVWDACYSMEQFRKRRWDNLDFAPGSTIELEWDIPEFEFNSFGIIGDPYQLCVTAELPNYSFDYNPSNNRSCATTLYVNTPEPALNAVHLKALPNPATGQVQVEWSLPVQQPVVVRLHNAIGQLVHEAPGNLAEQLFLPTQAAGWYVVSLWRQGQRLAQQKVVWR